MKKRLRRDADTAVLRGIEIFSILSDTDLLTFSTKMSKRSFLPGQTIFRENESGAELFVIASGLVAVTVTTQDGEVIELSRVGIGAFFGEMAILERAPRSATCTALETTECLVLAAADFESLIVDAPNAAVGVLERMLVIAAGRLVKTGSFLSQMVQWGDTARKRAITDSATGLFNRRYLEDSFESIVARASRERTELSYAMFDLDKFGKMNAAYGAEFCDRVILQAAEAFRKVFSEEDIIVRYGGDEFCFVIPSSPAEAERKCGAVCAALRALDFPEHPELKISCSIGLAHLPSTASNAEELKEKADKALYAAKEAGRDRVSVAAIAAVTTVELGESTEIKHDILTVSRKNRVIANIAKAIEERDSFLMIGHKDPDEDCISSMVAFALIVNKFNKRAAIVLGSSNQDNFIYLLNICRYNSIEIFQDEAALRGALPAFSTLVLLDTPKPQMIDHSELYNQSRSDPAILKIELDHHLEADSRYFGDPDYRLVYEASSTCEIIGRLAMKMENNVGLKAAYQIEEILSRNLVLAILSGMIGDSQMGRYLKSPRERWFYARFSSLFERMLAKETKAGSGNYSNKEQVFSAMVALSQDEDACFRFMSKAAESIGRVRLAVLDEEASRFLFATYGNDTVVAVSKALVDTFAEASGCMGLVGYYDDLARSSFVQFRLRRSQAFTAIDLREALAALKITNGGGHPGAVGFRLERVAVPDIRETARVYARALADMTDAVINKGVSDV
ncbi:MAG: diguanylate cyclase [Treponemataceae bacterium]